MVIQGRHKGAIVVLKKLMPAQLTIGIRAWYIASPIPTRWSTKNGKPDRWTTGFAQRILVPLDEPLPSDDVTVPEELTV